MAGHLPGRTLPPAGGTPPPLEPGGEAEDERPPDRDRWLEARRALTNRAEDEEPENGDDEDAQHDEAEENHGNGKLESAHVRIRFGGKARPQGWRRAAPGTLSGGMTG